MNLTSPFCSSANAASGAKLISHRVFGLGPLSCLSLLCTRVWEICSPGDRVTAPKGCSETQSGSDTAQPVRPSA